MNKHEKLTFMQKLLDEAWRTWMTIFNKEDHVTTCEEAWRMRLLAERAMMRMKRRSYALKEYKLSSGLH